VKTLTGAREVIEQKNWAVVEQIKVIIRPDKKSREPM